MVISETNWLGNPQSVSLTGSQTQIISQALSRAWFIASSGGSNNKLKLAPWNALKLGYWMHILVTGSQPLSLVDSADTEIISLSLTSPPYSLIIFRHPDSGGEHSSTGIFAFKKDLTVTAG